LQGPQADSLTVQGVHVQGLLGKKKRGGARHYKGAVVDWQVRH
jgi:hypothetical protein